MKIIYLIVFINIFGLLNAQQLAVLKYKGGGDWYSNPTALPNLIKFCNQKINTNLNTQIATVEPGSIDIFQYPMIHMTGHGNVVFDFDDIKNLRDYLYSGGFIHIDDNYGMAPFIKKEIKKLFPDQELVDIPSQHPIFNTAFNFPDGLPKIHEHDGKAPKAQGIFIEDRLVLLLTLESDLGDGWEDQEVHNDTEDVRLKALKMGANIVQYVFSN